MEENRYDNEVKVESVDEGTDFNDKSPSHMITAKFHAISDINFKPRGSGFRLAM